MLCGMSVLALISKPLLQVCKAAYADLIVYLQVGGPDKELALSSISVVLDIHEHIFDGTGYDTPAGARMGPLHCEGLASTCLPICNDCCIVPLQ